MALLSIVTFPDDLLRQQSKEVKDITDDDQRLIDDMIETMFYNKGVGLAAPQVGVLKNIIVVSPKANRKEVFVYINPVITKMKGEVVDHEGCLSVPCASGQVVRGKKIWVETMDREGEKVSFSVSDFHARIIQHETDHLHGKLFIDHLGFAARKEAIEAAKKAKEL